MSATASVTAGEIVSPARSVMYAPKIAKAWKLRSVALTASAEVSNTPHFLSKSRRGREYLVPHGQKTLSRGQPRCWRTLTASGGARGLWRTGPARESPRRADSRLRHVRDRGRLAIQRDCRRREARKRKRPQGRLGGLRGCLARRLRSVHESRANRRAAVDEARRAAPDGPRRPD